MEYPQLFSKGGLIPCVYCGTIVKVPLTRGCSYKEINGQKCYCCNQCFLLDPLDEFDRQMIEKNKLSNTLWKDKYGNLKRGKCDVCDIKISKYDFATWCKMYPNDVGSWGTDNLDIVCNRCKKHMFSKGYNIIRFKEDYKDKFEKEIKEEIKQEKDYLNLIDILQKKYSLD